jgi:hypothetical protein
MYVKTNQVKPFAVSFIPDTFQIRDGIYTWPNWPTAEQQIEWKQATVHAYWYDVKRGQKTACYGVMLINIALDVIRSYDKDPEQLTYDNFLATAASKYQFINAQRVGSFYRYSNDPVIRLSRGNYYKEYGAEPEADYDHDKLVQMLEVDLPEFDGLDGWYVLNSKLPVRAVVKK